MSETQVSTFLILFLNTLLVILLPDKSNSLKFRFTLKVAAKGSIHFSVNLLFAKFKLVKLLCSATPLDKC